jgi:hypothetical protein
MSQEYILSIVLVLGGVLKLFNIEIENSSLEGLIGGAIALYVAIRRYQKKDITLMGFRK